MMEQRLHRDNNDDVTRDPHKFPPELMRCVEVYFKASSHQKHIPIRDVKPHNLRRRRIKRSLRADAQLLISVMQAGRLVCVRRPTITVKRNNFSPRYQDIWYSINSGGVAR